MTPWPHLSTLASEEASPAGGELPSELWVPGPHGHRAHLLPSRVCSPPAVLPVRRSEWPFSSTFLHLCWWWSSLPPELRSLRKHSRPWQVSRRAPDTRSAPNTQLVPSPTALPSRGQTGNSSQKPPGLHLFPWGQSKNYTFLPVLGSKAQAELPGLLETGRLSGSPPWRRGLCPPAQVELSAGGGRPF